MGLSKEALQFVALHTLPASQPVKIVQHIDGVHSPPRFDPRVVDITSKEPTDITVLERPFISLFKVAKNI
jgi:hypothetical protein